MRLYIYTQAQKETYMERGGCVSVPLPVVFWVLKSVSVYVQVSLPLIVYGRSHHVRILVAVGYSVFVSIVTALQFLRPLAANVYATAAYRYTHNGHIKLHMYIHVILPF
jgi:hypothetical protein